MYEVRINRRAMKSLSRLPGPDYFNIKRAIYSLVSNPRPHGYIKLKGRDAFRIRVGDYRVIYQIFDDLLVVEVIDLGHRKEIY